MVRGGSTATPSKKKEKDAVVSEEAKAEELESKRLRDLAFSRGLLSRTQASPGQPLRLSKSLLNCDGRDIVKKGHRKTKYLFAFPGLMAPVAAGKLGELTKLDSKNPILYVDFPQGRLKLFGTIVYPKNRYLTLHLARGSGNVVCEDCFESLVVFSLAWWIGSKEDNPEELRLPWPKHLEQDKHADFDFIAGAGRAKETNAAVQKKEKDDPEVQGSQFNLESLQEPKAEASENESKGKDVEPQVTSPPVRQSTRTAGRKLKYIESSSDDKDDDGDSTDSLEFQQDLKSRKRKQVQTPKQASNKVGAPSGANATVILDSDGDTPKKKQPGPAAAERNLSSALGAMTTTVSESSLTEKTPVAGLGASARELKQTKLEAFSERRAQQESPNVVEKRSTPRRNSKVSADVLIESPKVSKRPLKSPYKDEREDSDFEDSSYGEMGTSSKGTKRIKSGEIASVSKGSVKRSTLVQPKTKPSKAVKDSDSIGANDGTMKQQTNRKTKKSMPGTTLKYKQSAGDKSVGRKSSNKGSDADVEPVDSDEPSDDSDEDWVG